MGSTEDNEPQLLVSWRLLLFSFLSKVAMRSTRSRSRSAWLITVLISMDSRLAYSARKRSTAASTSRRTAACIRAWDASFLVSSACISNKLAVPYVCWEAAGLVEDPRLMCKPEMTRSQGGRYEVHLCFGARIVSAVIALGCFGRILGLCGFPRGQRSRHVRLAACQGEMLKNQQSIQRCLKLCSRPTNSPPASGGAGCASSSQQYR